ncbi:hypothetical protein [Silvibacterium dinghuense]|uniref:Uncharacterized protein n=1 Tax=Silvibacterium dinghuense TaxID=1560006 RepID=A0A4Q1SKC6_9BACT|nr:hypothetical protein [Silvibacterium dinghuense]RXS97917.1 hypothetical protein ESZ00_08690 [Silvibacterium dinghuense]GGH02969.1 hypothetical protein GCM10011586_18580 [Silvibacterium dinghuense]
MRSNSSLSFKRLAAVLLGLPLAFVPAYAQQAVETDAVTVPAAHSDDSSSVEELPDAPGMPQQGGATAAAAPQNSDSAAEGKQTKRILGIIPNFRSVSVDAKLPPMSVKDKFIGATEDSFDYSSFIFAGLLAGEAQLENSYPQFHQGAAGYARYYWHTFADQTDENYMVEFFFPVALHQDPRYYTLERGGFFKRIGYSFSRIAITRQDDGSSNFNYSEVVGAGAAAGISALYYPGADRTWTKVGQRWATSVGLDGMTFVFKEFWPDINDHIFHQKD